MRLAPAFLVALLATACTPVAMGPAPEPAAPERVMTRFGVPNAALAQEVGMQINAIRAAAGRPALAPQAALIAAAQAHADDMLRRGYFSHTGANGSDIGQRLHMQGCAWRGAAENIAMGQRSAAEVVAQWAASAGHARNMLGNYTGFGVGQAGTIWVVTFATGC